MTDDTERLSLYAPKGTKALLEDYRRKNGFRSLNEVITHIIRSELAKETSAKTPELIQDTSEVV